MIDGEHIAFDQYRVGFPIKEPRKHWPDDGRVETIVDPNWLIDGRPRIVRRVGWRTCMCCRRRMFSADIKKIRVCDQCKGMVADKSSYG